jgi:hypothetical protein
VPRRVQLLATPGAAGADAAALLYRRRKPATVAPWATRATAAAIRRGLGVGRPAPLADLDSLCAALGITVQGAAAIRSSTPERLVLALIGEGPGLVVKVGSPADGGLLAEIDALRRLARTHPDVLAPRLHWHGSWRDRLVVATDALSRRLGAPEPSVEDAVRICRTLAAGGAGRFVVHGDLAPWNIVVTADGLALVDWESSRFQPDPMYDLAHYVTSTGSLLGAYGPARALSLLLDRRSPGWRYLDGLGIDPATAPALVASYLQRSEAHSPAAIRYRRAMLDRIDQRTRSIGGRRHGFAP